MRLSLRKKDFIRAQIISKKINPRVFSEHDMNDLKIRFNEQMISYYKHGKNFLEIAKCLWQIYETVKEEEKKLSYLQLLVIFVILSPHDNEQSDFINRLNTDVLLEKIIESKQLLKQFLTIEIMEWKFINEKTQAIFSDFEPLKKLLQDDWAMFWEEFHLRVLEHNIRVVEKYYTRITLPKLCQFLSLDAKETEYHVGRLMVSGSIYAKIDRPHNIIVFRKAQSPAEKLNNWGRDIDSLLKIVETTCHLIERENMIYKLNQ